MSNQFFFIWICSTFFSSSSFKHESISIPSTVGHVDSLIQVFAMLHALVSCVVFLNDVVHIYICCPWILLYISTYVASECCCTYLHNLSLWMMLYVSTHVAFLNVILIYICCPLNVSIYVAPWMYLHILPPPLKWCCTYLQMLLPWIMLFKCTYVVCMWWEKNI